MGMGILEPLLLEFGMFAPNGPVLGVPPQEIDDLSHSGDPGLLVHESVDHRLDACTHPVTHTLAMAWGVECPKEIKTTEQGG